MRQLQHFKLELHVICHLTLPFKTENDSKKTNKEKPKLKTAIINKKECYVL